MTSTYIEKLSLTSQSINIDAQKIDSLLLETYGIVTVEFSVYNKLGRG